MQWKCLPVPTYAPGKPAIHDTDGALWQACIASVAHHSAEKHLDTSVLHGNGTNTVAPKGVMALATRQGLFNADMIPNIPEKPRHRKHT